MHGPSKCPISQGVWGNQHFAAMWRRLAPISLSPIIARNPGPSYAQHFQLLDMAAAGVEEESLFRGAAADDMFA